MRSMEHRERRSYRSKRASNGGPMGHSEDGVRSSQQWGAIEWFTQGDNMVKWVLKTQLCCRVKKKLKGEKGSLWRQRGQFDCCF